MKRDASFGERERLLVMVAHQRDVGLVVHDAGENVVSLNSGREPFALPERRDRVFGPSGLREQHCRERVDEREMPPIACLLPMSVCPNPPLVSPPSREPGSMSTTDFPMRDAWIAAATPPDVPP